MKIVVTAALVALALAVAGGCGGSDDDKSIQPIPAAGQFTPSAKTPGVPIGSSYDVTGNEWLKLADPDRFTAAQDYVADHPSDCSNADGRSAAADPVRNFVDSSIGTDYPLNAPIAELLAEGCAAALQSGDQDLAPTSTAGGPG